MLGYGNSGTQTSYQVFTEQLANCSGYAHSIHGTPTSTNYAYYTGYTQYAPCIVPQSEFALNKRDFYNPPFAYKYLDAAFHTGLAASRYL